MRRRLDLAAALVHRPPVLFLDEPTTGLDPQGRTELWGVIEELVGGGTTVLLTTQYLEEADRLADNIVVIDHGTRDRRGHRRRAEGATRRDGRSRSALRDDDAAARPRPSCSRRSAARRVDGKLVRVNVPATRRRGRCSTSVRVLDARAARPRRRMVLREPTLDDVFLELTGHAAEEPTSDDADAADRSDRGAA